MAHVVVNDDVIAGTSICSQGNYKHLSVHLIFLKTLWDEYKGAFNYWHVENQ